MSEHTPGPWQIEPLDCIGPHDREGRADIVLWDADLEGFEVVVRAAYFDDVQAKANARLISAAPELLEALDRLVVAADTFSVSGVYFNSFKENFAALKKAMEAIEKSRGEA
jgi:hypothetical protein